LHMAPIRYSCNGCSSLVSSVKLVLAGLLCLLQALPIWATTLPQETMNVTRPQAEFQRPRLIYNVSGSNSWYPYYIASSTDAPGILNELLPQILALAGIEGQTRALPPNRTNQALDTGELDFDIVSPSWFPNLDFGPLFVKSMPIMRVTEHLVTVPAKAADWQDISYIKGQTLGTIRGYLYHDDKDFTRMDFPSEQYLVQALHKGRIQVAIIDAYTARYWAAQLKLPISLAAVHSSGDLVFRLRAERKDLLPAIDQAIDRLVRDGTVARLIEKYTQGIAVD
jgi:polar amino acid transport system substrate-binding protein